MWGTQCPAIKVGEERGGGARLCLDAQLRYEAFEGVLGQRPIPGEVVPLSALTAVEDVVLLGQAPGLQRSACGAFGRSRAWLTSNNSSKTQTAHCGLHHLTSIPSVRVMKVALAEQHAGNSGRQESIWFPADCDIVSPGAQSL